MKFANRLLLSFFIIWIFSCNQENPSGAFVLVDSGLSGVEFNNVLTETDSLNYFTYPYLYLGGGVATGDFNNDDLPDIFFTGNMVENKLYLNRGAWKFEDISNSAGIKGSKKWYTGVTLCDINEDGWLDIYVCVSGAEGNLKNELYINNQDLTFTEAAEKYGIADAGASIQSVFFDYDQDGDLDLLIANYPATPFSSPNAYYQYKMENLEWLDSDHLYENQGNGTFTDVSEKSGIANFGLTLGVSIGDFNQDGYPDIYLSNDFSTPDRFYINQGDGSFQDKLKISTYQNALFGMGSDAADYNNDGLLDLVQVDMTPGDNKRSKENMASMNPAIFWNTVEAGFHYQYMYNTLQVNQGIDSKGDVQFSNVARLAGISTTDWSWAPLFADFDNDGWKDVFITNGIKRDVNNKDFFEKMKLEINFSGGMQNISHEQIPSEPVPNQAFRNKGDLSFEKVSESWNLDLVGFSHGTAYADFDQDGDLDLVVNNMDQLASLYDNQIVGNHSFLKLKLKGPANNPFGIGTKVFLYQGDRMQYQELTLSRGFQSSVETDLNFGLGDKLQIDSLKVIWPDGNLFTLKELKPNSIIPLDYASSIGVNDDLQDQKKVLPFQEITAKTEIDFMHKENFFNDYLFEPLLPHQTSKLGSGLAVGDVNMDGLEDIFIGNATGSAGALFLQSLDGTFTHREGPWIGDAACEDMGSLFFDADGDQDLDLYVVSGGNEFFEEPSLLQDRLYLNDGQGQFTKSLGSLPEMESYGSKVKAADFDQDGDLDLFVAGKMKPRKYPLADRSYLLLNEGIKNGTPSFKDVTADFSEELTNPGIVKDFIWTDFDQDQQMDLILVGEWMPVLFFRNAGDQFLNQTALLGDPNAVGWWSAIAESDYDQDGDPDYLIGNLGTNYKYQATPSNPFELYVGDFDQNESLDLVLSYQQEGKKYPLRGRECSSEQIPAIKHKFKDYNSFASATLEDVYGKKNLENAIKLQATHFSSSLLVNNTASFELLPLPNEAQFSSVNCIVVKDLNEDQIDDYILAGNLFSSEVETPRNDANLGLVLLGRTDATLKPKGPAQTGLYLPGDVKDAKLIRIGKAQAMAVLKNDGPLRIIQLSKQMVQ